MVEDAARAARAFGKRTVLGGMMPVDADWLALMERHGALADIDVIAIHGFPPRAAKAGVRGRAG